MDYGRDDTPVCVCASCDCGLNVCRRYGKVVLNRFHGSLVRTSYIIFSQKKNVII